MEKETKHTPEEKKWIIEIGSGSLPYRILTTLDMTLVAACEYSDDAKRIVHAVNSTPTLLKENERLEKECFHLAAHQCPHSSCDDHGHQYCAELYRLQTELSEMKKEREELVQGKSQVISMCRDLIEICERHLPMAGAPSDWMTVRETIEAIKK